MSGNWCSCGHQQEDHTKGRAFGKNECAHSVWVHSHGGKDLQPCPCVGFEAQL